MRIADPFGKACGELASHLHAHRVFLTCFPHDFADQQTNLPRPSSYRISMPFRVFESDLLSLITRIIFSPEFTVNSAPWTSSPPVDETNFQVPQRRLTQKSIPRLNGTR